MTESTTKAPKSASSIPNQSWTRMRVKRAVRVYSRVDSLIKGQLKDSPEEGLYPAYSASGQDVWTDKASFRGPGIVLSAVGARCGKAFKADGEWAAAANTHVLFPEPGLDRDYLWYFLNNEDWWEKGGAAQPYVRVSDSLRQEWSFPLLKTQQAIADFLDRKTEQIDALIEKKQRMIELLEEKRQALITQAVTKGLDPNVPMKDTGVPWLGEVPEHPQSSPLPVSTPDS